MARYQKTLMLTLPRSPQIDISFTDVYFTVSLSTFTRAKKEVLKGVSGVFRSGELTAIMGPSGAGKSSLLNILTGYQRTGMSGCIKLNEQSVQSSSKKLSCYIMQEDHLSSRFTVIEVMTMAANLKLGPPLSKKAKKLVVEDVLDSLGLSSVKYTKCGRLSGGQKKRLCIALELIDNPPIMYLDEPTTGLDSTSTLQLVKLLKSMANSGRTIVCTIHQPSATVFELFDQIYLLAEGNCVYQGSSKRVIPFLQTVGLHCPAYHNPADFILDVINGDFGSFNDQLRTAGQDPIWKIQPICNKDTEKTDLEENKGKTCVLVSSPTELSKFCTLFRKNIIYLHRDWTITYLKVLLHFMVGITMGLMFQEAGHYGERTISNVSYFLCAVVYLSFTSIMPAALKFPTEISIVKKEMFNNWYKLRTYYFAFLAANMPVQLIFCSVFVSTSYYLSGQLLEIERFIKFLITCEITIIISESIGLALGTIGNPVNGIFWGSVLLAVKIVLAGFLVIFSHMPRIFYYISFGNFLRYSLESLTYTMYGFGRENLPCSKEILYCHFRYPEKLLSELAMENVDYWRNISVLGTFFGISCFNTYFFLYRKIKSR